MDPGKLTDCLMVILYFSKSVRSFPWGYLDLKELGVEEYVEVEFQVS